MTTIVPKSMKRQRFPAEFLKGDRVRYADKLRGKITATIEDARYSAEQDTWTYRLKDQMVFVPERNLVYAR